MKKVLIPIVIIFAILVACLTVGCNSTTLDKGVGTYMLTTKTEQRIDAEEATDFIDKYGIKCFVVLDGSEKGYYVYGDNDTPTTCKEIKVEYIKSTDDEKKISSVRLYLNPDNATDYDSYFVNYDSKTKKNYLVYKKQAIRSDLIDSLNYAKTTEFTQLSTTAAISVVNGYLGADLKVIPYALSNLHGLNAVYAYDTDTSAEYVTPYVYYFYDIDAANRTAKIYYALKSDLVRHEETATITYDISGQTEDTKGTVTIGETVFTLTSSYYASRTETIDGKTISFDLYRTGENDIETAIENAINEYNASLPPEEDGGETAGNE